MVYSRLGRFQERKLTKRLILAIAGMVGLLLFVLFFGVKILINFSLLVDKLRGSGPTDTQAPVIILPPTLDWMPQATNSAVINLSGSGQPEGTVVIYVNDSEARKIKTDADGKFTIRDLSIISGENTISARTVDDKGNISEPSNALTVSMSKTLPTLEITSPQSDGTVTGDNNQLTVTGRTEYVNTVTVNGRYVVVRGDGTFIYSLSLSEGDNTLTAIAQDDAGNQTKVERKIKFQK